VMLRNELEGKKAQREDLRRMLDEARKELSRIERQCTQAQEQRETCRDDVVRMQEDMERARKEAINIRAEMKQMTYFQENVDTETKHRLSCDVQNLEMEKDMDAIRMRHLNTDRERLRKELETLKAERDALEVVRLERRKELSEAKMTKEMYSAHQEVLALHLQTLGGDHRLFGSFMADGFRQSFSLRDMFKNKKSSIRGSIDESSIGGDSSAIINTRFGAGCNSIKGHLERPRMEKRISQSESRSRLSPREVGGVVLGADTVGSSDFLRKLPTIFKMGGGSGEGNVEEYISNKEREVEFASDSHSISGISAITTDEDAWTEGSESEEPG